jgi:hypothetical protein
MTLDDWADMKARLKAGLAKFERPFGEFVP